MREFKGTKAPWRWELNKKSKDLNLCGHGECGPYDYTVMDFERWGMGGAVPRFRVAPSQTMVKAFELSKIVKGREHHKEWFQDIDHPDAKLIAAAPELMECLQAFVNSCYKGCTKEELNHLRIDAELVLEKILA